MMCRCSWTARCVAENGEYRLVPLYEDRRVCPPGVCTWRENCGAPTVTVIVEVCRTIGCRAGGAWAGVGPLDGHAATISESIDTTRRAPRTCVPLRLAGRVM